MKSILVSLLAFLSVAHGEVFRVVTPTQGEANWPPSNPEHLTTGAIGVPSGSTLKVLGILSGNNSEVAVHLTIDGLHLRHELGQSKTLEIAGPVTVAFSEYMGLGPAVISYSIHTPDDSSKSNPAVIPDDNSGNHAVILEASTDMKTWEPVQPGSYPTTTMRRFFRVRIQKQ
jgi:hypothetical protein